MEKDNEPETPLTSAAISKTTTISTIAVQSGRTRIVIALLHCGNWLQLKILEITPELTALGDTLEAAIELQKAHNEVLRQLQNKQSPVEELLRQADQLIVTQKPRAEVYAAMAETLGRAWKDINYLLELRKQILDLNVQYHSKANEFFETINKLEESCKDTIIPVEIEAVKSFLTNIHDLRRTLLEYLMAALQTGNCLLGKLRELGVDNTIDSRPDKIKPSVNKAISQVQSWLDLLHIRRQDVEFIFGKRKLQLEQCLALAILAADLSDLEEKVYQCRTILANTDELGDSASSAELLLHENKKLILEAQQLQEKAVKITKATEQLLASGCFASEEATKQSYAILSATSDYLTDVQNRNRLLERAIQFFRSAQSAENKLDQLEIQLTTTELPKTSPQLSELHAQCAKAIETITEVPISEGYEILNTIGAIRRNEGIKKRVEDLENKKIRIGNLCVAHKEENQRINKALNNFYEKYEILQVWLTNIAEAFLQGHKDMGNDLNGAQAFISLHNELLKDLQIKGNEINSLLLTLPSILEYLEDNQRRDVDCKVEELHEKWLKLKTILENRLDLGHIYVKFHTEADIFSREVDKLEFSVQGDCNLDDEALKQLEFQWESLTPLYQSAKNTGLTFINDAKKVSELHLDTNRAISCVEAVLERLAGRQLLVTRAWQTFHTNVVETREIFKRLEETMSESTKTVHWVTKLEAELYPVITTTSLNPKEISLFIENKLQHVLPDITKAKKEVAHKIQTAEQLISKAKHVDDKVITVKNKLNDLNKKLQTITDEYQRLLEKIVTYFNQLNVVDNLVEKIKNQLNNVGSISNVDQIEAVIKDNDKSQQKITDHLKNAQNECDQLIHMMATQEPIEAAQHDIEKLTHTLSLTSKACEDATKQRLQAFNTQREFLRFDGDLKEIHDSIGNLENQLLDLRGRYGKSLPEAQSSSSIYADFENTVRLIEEKIEPIKSFGNALIAQKHPQHAVIENNLQQLNGRWNDFKKHVEEMRNLIDLSIKYFELINEANDWFKEASRLLMSIARRTTLVKKPSEADELLQEINIFLKPGEEAQNKRIEKIIALSNQIYGPDIKSQIAHVINENKEILQSFNTIMNELNVLNSNLILKEEEQLILQKEQEELQAKLAIAKAEAEAAEAAALLAEKERLAAAEATKIAELEALEKQKEAERFAEQKTKEAEAEIARLKEKALAERLELEKQQRREAELLVEQQKKAIEDEIKLFREKALAKELEINRQEQIISVENQNYSSNKPTLTLLESPIFISPLKDAFIEEGSKFTFICEVTGTPIPKINWYKAGILIQNNPDYQTTFEDGICTLTIEETFTEDSAEYTCKATNEAGSAETTGILSVKEAESDDPRIPPTFSKLLEPAVVTEGQEFKFHCKVEGYPLPTVQWFKNQECIDNSLNYCITYNNGDATLSFTSVKIDDAAEYTCTATNELGVSKSMANISVTSLPSAQEPVFIVPLIDATAMTGEELKLQCEVTGNPSPNLTWLHNEFILKETDDLKIQHEGNKATLVIYEAYLKDAGTYTVNASNIAGKASSSCTVLVKGRPPVETSDSELKTDSEVVSDMESIKPSIQVPLTNVNITEGEKVRLDCIIIGQPEPEVIWYHDKQPVKESDDFQLLFQGDKCSLIIEEALPEDQGEYKVVAINSAGEASSTCMLQVTPQEKPTGNPPKFLRLIDDALVSEGDKVIFTGSVIGEPKPEINWYLNNCLIINKDNIKFDYTQEGEVKLEIENVKADDKGVYTVKASNPYGDAKCFAQLIVKSLKVPEKTKFESSPPVFTEQLTNKVVFANTSTTFECTITGMPKPNVTWLFNGQVIDKDWNTSSSGNQYFLHIPNVTKSLEGAISCSAENEAGKVTSIASLSVESLSDITLPEQKLVKVAYPDTSYIVKQTVHSESSISSSSRIISSSSEMHEPEIKVHSLKQHDEKCFKQINENKPEITETHSTEEFVQMGRDQPIIHQQSTVTKSSHGDKVGEEQAPKVIKTIKTRPPKFITPFVGKIVDQGVNVSFEGTIDSQPSPTITWTKNGIELTPSDRIIFSKELNKITLEILNVSSNDAGKYTCTAINDAGTAITTADLVIRKTVFPPVFGRRLQAQVIKKGDRIVMEVEVTGTPEPTILWYKDTEPIENVLTDNYKIKSYGNSHTMIIEKAELKHSGRFMVKATNSGGEAQSIADIAVFEPTPDTMVEVVKTVVFEDIKKHETLNASSNQISSSSSIQKPIEIPKYEIQKEVFSDNLNSRREISVINEHHVSQEIKTLKLNSNISDIVPSEVPVLKSLIKENEFYVHSEPTENKVELPEVAESGIDNSSITKKSSLQYFVKKIKQNEIEPEKPIQSYVKHEAHRQIETYIPTVRQRALSTISLEGFDLNKGTDQESKKNEENDTLKNERYIPITLSKNEDKPLEQNLFTSKHDEVLQGYQAYEIKHPPTESVFLEENKNAVKLQTPIENNILQSKRLQDFYESSSIIHQSREIRAVSPRPEALQMEKLWTTRRDYEQPTLIDDKSLSIRPHSSLGYEASTNSLVMEKEWSHKFSTLPSKKNLSTSQSSTKKSVTIETRPKSLVETILPTHYVANVSHPIENVTPVILNQVDQSKSIESKHTSYSSSSVKWQPSLDSLNIRPVSVQDITDEVYLEPGSPPIIAYAQPPKERRPSYVETVEHQLETKLEKGPTKVPPGGVRTIPPAPIEKIIPPPLPPKKEQLLAPPIPAKPKFKEVTIQIQTPEKFPELEPFPFKPSAEKPKTAKVAPPPTPTKFVKGRFTDSDYESDMESSKKQSKWKPSLSDTEDLSYRKVLPPKLKDARPKSMEKEPLPPSVFEQPLPSQGPPRPQINFEKQYTVQHTKKENVYVSKGLVVRQISPPPMKPGSPPLFLETQRKPESPKVKRKVVTDGYMADTDEPRFQHKIDHQEYKQEIKSVSYNQIGAPSVKVAPKVPSKPQIEKELTQTPIITNVSTKVIDKRYEKQYSQQKYSSCSQKKSEISKGQPLPNPSKFVKSEFRESDYESDFDKPIPKVWAPSKTSIRPKFEPIDKPKSTVKLEHIIKPEPRPAAYKYITPSNEIVLRPGTPPEMAYTSGPQKTQYYTSITSTPYHNAVQTETSNVVHFKESNQNCHRTVSMQQSTKVIKFGDKRSESKNAIITEPARLKSACPTVLKPKMFVPGEFRESDYESEVENVRIKPIWAPSGSDTEDLQFRSVRPPSSNSRSLSVPPQQRILTPLEFDTYPPYKATDVIDGEYKKWSDKTSNSLLQARSKSQEPVRREVAKIQPGPPPEYGYVPSSKLKSTATSIATKHMDNMTETFKSKTQKFAKDIIRDVNQKETGPKMLKDDGQVYREETRASQHGTKHIDPDTGLIYFKYDFGYEFGIILPGESKPGEIIFPKKTIIEPPKRSADIEMPVYHETTQQNATSHNGLKNIRWEPTSESELSEYETDGSRKRTKKGSQRPKGISTPINCPDTPGSNLSQKRTSHSQILPPMFITPLRDIAVVSGQSAKFECIVQSEPPPNILWSKNGRILEDNNDYQLHMRNGVCRLTISRAYPEDAGTYTCTATNNAGTVSTTATLDVPGVPSHMYGTYRDLNTDKSLSSDLDLYTRPKSPVLTSVGKSNGLHCRLQNYH